MYCYFYRSCTPITQNSPSQHAPSQLLTKPPLSLAHFPTTYIFLSKIYWNMLFAQFFLLLFLAAYLWTIDVSCCFVSSVWPLVSTFVVCFGDNDLEWSTLSAHKSQKVIKVPEVIPKKRKYILNFFPDKRSSQKTTYMLPTQPGNWWFSLMM